MELHDLRPAEGSRKGRKRVGRGHATGHGKTSGRGHKGQRARSGYSRRHGFEGGQMPLHRRLPKRGFRHRKRFEHSIVNVHLLNDRFSVKILGRGEITKKLTIRVQAISEGARKLIEGAGGTVTIERKESASKTEAKPQASEKS